jgi:hypothetical protein
MHAKLASDNSMAIAFAIATVSYLPAANEILEPVCIAML